MNAALGKIQEAFDYGQAGVKLAEQIGDSEHIAMASGIFEAKGMHWISPVAKVNEKLLRFDFSHFSKMSREEILAVEKMVNDKVRENILIEELRDIPIDEAKAKGAMALFGEKYGEAVRVIIFDQAYSIELCGGTHVKSTGQIGLFKIISESSISAGVRRIEAITGAVAESYIDGEEEILLGLKELLKHPKDINKAITTLINEKNSADKEFEELKKEKVGDLKEDLIKSVESVNGVNVIIQKVEVMDASGLKQLGFEIKNQVPSLFMVLVADIKGKPQIAVVISEDIVNKLDLHAGNIVKELAVNIRGGGGGQPFFATAGGSDVSGLNKVLESAKSYIS